MMDWSYERRALWLYHHQHTIDSQLYSQQLQNAQLRAEIDRLKAQNVAINNEYVDKDFQGQEDLMYSDEHVAAAYNPTPAPVASEPADLTALWWTLGILFTVVIVGGGVYLVFIKDWKVEE